MRKCPCEECICRPKCRNKGYHALVKDCNILWQYINTIPYYSIYQGSGRNEYLEKTHKILKTDKWRIESGPVPYEEEEKKSFWKVLTSKIGNKK
jgi:hypothetical protein